MSHVAPVRSASIALIDVERQLQVLDTHDRRTAQTAGGQDGLLWGTWGHESPKKTAHSWPTWSPDGQRLACFAAPEGESPSVLVTQVDGIESAYVAQLQGRLPIYLFWSPDGANLATLTQSVDGASDRLHLSVCPSGSGEGERHVAEGSPLFFTWAEDRLAAFIGDSEGDGARMSLFPSDPRQRTLLLPGRPGNFCAPIWLGDRVMYVLQAGARASVVTARLDDPEPRVIETLRGLVALVRSPDGTRVARAVAPEGDGSPYRDLAVIDVATGKVTHVADHPCLAFVWLPGDAGLLTARVDTERNLMRWSHLRLDGTSTPLVDMYPTRDFGFYLRFFEQYAQSHHLVDPAGQGFLLAGGVFGQGDPHRTHAIWEVPLSGDTPQRVADGVFGVYGPRRG